MAQAETDLIRWAAEGIRAVAWDDAEVAEQLAGLPDVPALLFLRGHLQPADRALVSVIGTRRPSSAGAAAAAAIASALCHAGISVMSGLASGIDTAAHRAALNAGGRSIGVLGTGLRCAYPAENSQLQERLQILVSEFLPDAGPRAEHFGLRNALMSALSVATVIVEAGERSGVRIQARHALDQGRPVFLLRPTLGQAWARTLAERPGVQVINGTDDLLDRLAPWRG